MKLRASIGKLHPAEVTKEWEGTFAEFVKAIITKVPIVEDKASAGWVCGVHFKPAYRHSENFVARHFLSLDYDQITPDDHDRIIGAVKGTAFLAYTTWSHTPASPRLRLWIPLSRPATSEEFQAVSRRVAARAGIELAARESHTPCQFMYRPTASTNAPFQSWQDTTSPYLDVDKVLGEYSDWKDKSQWPRRADHDELYNTDDVGSPLDKPGFVGDFCRTFRITEAIARFDLPYGPGSSEDRWTYTGGSRADGAVIYDDDTKLHSHHDTDPARGQHNAYDLVRLHRFGRLDEFDADTPIGDRPSTRAMHDFCSGLPEFDGIFNVGFTAIEDVADGSAPETAECLPSTIDRGVGPCTDLENARRIQRAFGKRIISVAGNFYIWHESHWKLDTHEGEVWRTITKLPLMIKAEAVSLADKYGPTMTDEQQGEVEGLLKWATKCSNKPALDACREMLRKLLNVDGELLNTDRRLFNARNGTINLETSETKPHDPADLITACAPTDYDPAAKCDRFEAFVSEIFEDKPDVVAFVRRWLGYCVTGESREQALVFHVGKGGNGKSTLMRVLGHVLGSYAAMGPRSLLTGKGEIRNDVAALVGKRMITLNETKQNEEFDQAQLKELTGGDKLSARFLHKEFFEFNPTHKLQIFTNHEPTIIGDDGGMWRRMLLLRYRVRYGTAAQVATGEYQKLRDAKLEDTLKAEAPGILRWLVEGAREWYRAELNAPPSVLKDTARLRAEQDVLAQFVRERIVKDPAGKLPFSDSTESIYQAYKGWVHENGHKAFARGKFMKNVREALPTTGEGRWTEKGKTYRGFLGIRLARDSDVTE